MDIKYSFSEASKIRLTARSAVPIFDIINFNFACHKHKKKIGNTLIKQPYLHTCICEKKKLMDTSYLGIHIVTLRYPKSGL